MRRAAVRDFSEGYFRSAASPSQMGRFETAWLTLPENLAALADLPGRWIDTNTAYRRGFDVVDNKRIPQRRYIRS